MPWVDKKVPGLENIMGDKVTPITLLFTLSTLIWSVRKILIEDYGYSETKANTAILLAVDAEKQISKLDVN